LRFLFPLYPIDRDWAEDVPGYYRQLVDSFDYFVIAPTSRKLTNRPAATTPPSICTAK
jgi:hypothetical protein